MSVEIRVMTANDLPAGMRLKDLAGWNQTEEDWQRFLASSPDGCFVAEWGGHVAGTVTTIVYEQRFAWIGMVLVDPAVRGKGIGTALLERAIDHLDARRIPCLKLDATPQGKPIYQRLGFRVEYEIERCFLERAVPEATPPLIAQQPVEIDEVLELDREIFGAERSELLRSVARAAPEFAIVQRHAGTLRGYAFGRKGSRADHLGPWTASSARDARDLLDCFLRRSRRNTIFVDALKDNACVPDLMAQTGFKFSRTLTRMYRGENSYPGRPERLCAILGPEFG